MSELSPLFKPQDKPQDKPSSTSKALWIKNPQAVFTGNELDAAGGIVVQGSKIVDIDMDCPEDLQAI